MKIYKSLLLVLVCFFLFIPETFASGNANRIDGRDRYAVAVNVSKNGWSNASTVIISSGYAYADALAATPLAYLKNAPILLTHSDSLTSTTSTRLKELKPNQVIVVGGTKSVSKEVISDIKSLGISNIKRIDGQDRFEVAENISKELPDNNRAIIANGYASADALSIAPYAARNKIPILLTKDSSIPSYTNDALKTRGISSTIVVGGDRSINSSVFKGLPSPKRIDGKNRYEVATNIIKTFNLSTNQTFLVNGYAFADALTGSVLAAKKNAPILLSNTDKVPDETMNLIKEKRIENFIVLGGTKSLTTKVTSRITAPLVGKRIVLDAGHGDEDPGAVGNGIEEKDVVLDVVKRVNTKLNSADAVSYMTRSSDEFLELQERVEYAESKDADAFISVHANSFTSSSANGTETYWNSQYAGTDSKALAEEIQDRLVYRMGTQDRGVKEANFYVIKNNTMPSVLVELAFISNSSDAKKLKDPAYREKAAQAIYEGILNFYK